MVNFDKDIKFHEDAICKLKEDKQKYHDNVVDTINELIVQLTDVELLEIIESETTKRRKSRDEIRTPNEKEMSKINMIGKNELSTISEFIVFDEHGKFIGNRNSIEEVNEMTNYDAKICSYIRIGISLDNIY